MDLRYPPFILGDGTATGPILITDGSTSVPSLGLASDADGSGTGLYRLAANNLAVTINGTGRVNFSGSGINLDSGSSFLWTSSVVSAGFDTGIKRNAAKIVEVTDGASGWGAFRAGRVITGSATPTVAATGHGATGTATMATGSTDLAGTVIITPSGAGIAALGTVTVTFSTTNGGYATNAPVVVAMLSNSTGSWGVRATVIGTSAPTTTGFVLNWDNNAVALTGASVYHISYICIGK